MPLSAEDLYKTLKPIQEKQGYYFNPYDHGQVMDILSGLAVNKERYGYASCPCRLNTGSRELDRLIICPCYFRPGDVEAYGGCYCGLYVSREVVEGRRKLEPAPERWNRRKPLEPILGRDGNKA